MIRGTAARSRSLLLVLLAAMASLCGPAAGTAETPSFREEAWLAAQWAYQSQVDGALARSAAQAAQATQGGAALVALERRRSEIVAELSAIERLALAPGELDGDIAAKLLDLRTRRTALLASLDDIDRLVTRDYPAFADLVRPSAMPAPAIQALLNPDEALLFVVPADDATYVFALTRDRLGWHRSTEMTRDRIAKAVAAIRASVAAPKLGEPAPQFDYESANLLFRELIAPADALIASKAVLMTVTPGALGTLPLSLLVTDRARAEDRDSDGGWLIDRQALLSLPAVSSLNSLRCMTRPGVARHPGCMGKDPSMIVATSPVAPAAPRFVGVGAPTLLGAPGKGRGAAIYRDMFVGTLADPEKLRALPWLPGAKEELESLASDFGARGTIRIAAEATESFVKTDRRLRDATYILFSTHGLLGGEASVAAQPGLVFTPPSGRGTAEDDGYLTASEAAGLNLRAEVVALSACSTAGGERRAGSEGLSGLARGFFYAGARSLLVSHWEVDDSATAALMIRTFRGMERRDAVSRASALRAAIRSIRADTEHRYWAKPRYWAAFTLVGDHR